MWFVSWTLPDTTNLLLQSQDGGAAMGGIAAHGYVNGKAVFRPPGMSEANLPWPHLRPGRVEITTEISYVVLFWLN